ncbi:MAG: DinB family protein [Aeromicrobium erythreum]
MSDMWTDEATDPRTYGNPVGELATYVEYLANYRITLELKCQDLTPEQLATRSIPPSTMSLLGLVRHMARVEHHWFERVAQGVDEPRLFHERRDLDFDGALGTQECVDDAFALWRAHVRRAEEWVVSLDESDLGRELPMPGAADETVSIRDLLVHMIEEYARHCGHADLLRECVDGRTGQ